MMKLAVFILGIFPSWVLAAVIIERGQSQAVIVVSAKASDSVRYAAGELQSYLKEVSETSLPIQHTKSDAMFNIFVGESEFTKKLGLSTQGLKADGFKIVTGENWLAILGRDYVGSPICGMRNPWNYMEVYNEKLKLGAFGETGTLFGVYRFLEDICGIRWYLPGELGTVVPKKTKIDIGKIDLQVSPDYEYRYPWLCNFADSEEDVRWYRQAGFGAPFPAQIIDSFQFFLKYKDSHPEYFALIDGKRDFSNLSCSRGGGNLCLSNPEVIRQWITDINDYFDKNPNQFIYPLSPNDGMEKICECNKCQAQVDNNQGETGKFSNYVWQFIDKVARGVAVKHPDKFVGGIAYANYNSPPTRIKRLSPNVAVMICKTRGGYNDKAYAEKMQKTIAGWREKTNNIYFWEYYLYSWLPWRGLPVIYPHIIADDLKSLKGASKGEFIEAESWMDASLPPKMNFPGMQHLNLYVTAKLYWNADLNVDKLLDEYYEKFYGPARAEMKTFWTTAEDIWLTRGTDANPINVYRKAELDQLAGYLKSARDKTPENSVYRKRVELIQNEFIPAKRKLSNVLVLNPPQLDVAGPITGTHIDCVLDDMMWKDVDPAGFVDTNGETAAYKTWMYTGWDEKNLYLALINYEPEIAKLTINATARDQSYNPGMWEDDSVEIFICPNSKHRERCYQWIVNAQGLVWDGSRGVSGQPGVDDRWNSRCEVKTKIESNRWIVEIRIPQQDLAITDTMEGKTIAINAYRNRVCGKPAVYSCWSPILSFQRFTPERFGLVHFKKN
jgi:hypothetical protein